MATVIPNTDQRNVNNWALGAQIFRFSTYMTATSSKSSRTAAVDDNLIRNEIST